MYKSQVSHFFFLTMITIQYGEATNIFTREKMYTCVKSPPNTILLLCMGDSYIPLGDLLDIEYLRSTKLDTKLTTNGRHRDEAFSVPFLSSD